MRSKRHRADAGGVLDQAFVLDDLDGGERGARRHRVLLVRVVPEGPVAADVEARMRQHRRDRQDAAAERLAQHEDVGRHAIVLAGEHASGLAEAGRDLVEDQQRAVAIAGLAHAVPEARRRHVGHGADGLGDEAAMSPSRSSTYSIMRAQASPDASAVAVP